MTPGRVLVTGASGFVGTVLARVLAARGATVVSLSRRPGGAPGRLVWDPAAGVLPRAGLEDLDAVVHLAGANIAGARWTPARKALLAGSRIKGTRLLAGTLAGLERPPRVLVSSSAIGIYGDRGDELLDETSAPGEGFLADLARAWEAATGAAEARGIRVIHLRTALVLAGHGGLLARLRLPFGLGLGAVLGSGRQWMSWIVIEDLVEVILHLVARDDVRGPVIVASSGAVTNREFTRLLARALGRPAFLRAPALALRLALGEMADGLLLASQRVVPRRLSASGFAFREPALEPALGRLLAAGRRGARS